MLGKADQLCIAFYLQFIPDVFSVGINRVGRNEQLFSNFFTGFALGDQAHDLFLPPGELIQLPEVLFKE